MKKVLIVLLLVGLVAFCLIAAVGGYYGYRWYKVKKAQTTEALNKDLHPLSTQPSESTPAEPGTGETEPSTQPPPETPATKPEATPAAPPEWAKETPKAPQAPNAAPTTKPATTPPPSTSANPYSSTTEPAPSSTYTPPPTTTETAPPPTTEPAAPPVTAPYETPKKKAPKGTLGVIFETTAEQGDVLIHVDEQLMEKESFKASSSQKFRMTKNILLLPGPHKVRMTVVSPDGKTQGKEWQVDILENSVSVWKGEMKSFRAGIELKQIPEK